MATFDGVTFEERGRGNGGFLPVQGFKRKYAILPVPGGDVVYFQAMGWDASPLDIPARVTSAQLASLRGKVNVNGTLVFAGGTLSASGYQTTLVEVADVQEVKQPNDMFFCTLRLLIW